MEQSIKDKLMRYSEMLFEENQKFNLTGLKSLDDIRKVLIDKSIEPLEGQIVPRGTRFVDIGTGAGIPGVVIGIMNSNFDGLLIEANGKKVEFINKVIAELSLNNIKIMKGRAEEIISNPKLRGAFDWCFTRAFGPIYYSIEFGFPFLKKNGCLYIYSALSGSDLSDGILSHVTDLGGRLVFSDDHLSFGIKREGLLMIKERNTSSQYPRKFPLIKREAANIPETKRTQNESHQNSNS